MGRRKKKWYKPKSTTECDGKNWSKDKSDKYRHSVLSCIVNRDGYATAVRKMVSLSNVTKDSATERKARKDYKWLKKKYR